MKKQYAMIVMSFCAAVASAQDLTSKKGEPILPEQGDWSIGVNAAPFLEYAGNFFGKTTTNPAPTFSFVGIVQNINGKYFVDAQTAYRAGLRIGFGSQTQRQMVRDRGVPATPANYPTAIAMKENTWKHSTSNIGITGGIEKRKGKTRLQGFYGGELGINLGTSKDVFTYGNALRPVSTNTAEPVVDVDAADSFSGAANMYSVAPSTGAGAGRVIERKNGSTFSFGVRGFIGVEYFFLPKISLGGEFGWGIGIGSTGTSTTKIESIGNTGTSPNDVTGSTTVVTSKQNLFFIDTDSRNSIFGPSGSLRLNFHF